MAICTYLTFSVYRVLNGNEIEQFDKRGKCGRISCVKHFTSRYAFLFVNVCWKPILLNKNTDLQSMDIDTL